MPAYQFVGPAYTGRVRSVGWEECNNLYVENTESADGKYTTSLIGTPGTVNIPAWIFPNNGIVRGMYTTTKDSILMVVCGNILYQMPSLETGSPIALGTLSTLTTAVSMVDDGRYLSIADGTDLYVLDLQNPSFGFTTPLTGMVHPSYVTFIGGYTLCNNTYNDPAVLFPPTTTLVYYSNLYNASQWYVNYTGGTPDPTALTFLDAEGKADPIVSMIRVGDVIWLFGTTSYECHQITSDQDKPFSRVGGSLTDIGCYAAATVARMGEHVYFLGVTSHGGLSVYTNNGYSVQRISNHAIEYELGENVNASEAIGWCYESEGHQFYVLTMRGSDLTLVYDASTQNWHTRTSRVTLTDQQTCWEPIFASSRGTTTYVGSALYPRIFKLSLDQYTEWDGRPIKRVRTGPVIWSDLFKIRHNTLQIDMYTGIGQYDGLSVPVPVKVMMRFSDDNGSNWSNEEWADAGVGGDYKKRVRYNRLGMAYNRIYEITITANCPVEIVGASVISDTSYRQ